MLFYGYFLVAVVSVLLVAWGAIFWLMTRSVYPSGHTSNGDSTIRLGSANEVYEAASCTASEYNERRRRAQPNETV